MKIRQRQRAETRLSERRKGYVALKGHKKPGSMNPHKGRGRAKK